MAEQWLGSDEVAEMLMGYRRIDCEQIRSRINLMQQKW